MTKLWEFLIVLGPEQSALQTLCTGLCSRSTQIKERSTREFWYRWTRGMRCTLSELLSQRGPVEIIGRCD